MKLSNYIDLGKLPPLFKSKRFYSVLFNLFFMVAVAVRPELESVQLELIGASTAGMVALVSGYTFVDVAKIVIETYMAARPNETDNPQ